MVVTRNTTDKRNKIGVHYLRPTLRINVE